MCTPAIAIAAVSVVATIGGAIYSASAQQSAAAANARAQQELAAANARSAAEIAAINADMEYQVAVANASAMTATAEANARLSEIQAKRTDAAADAAAEAGRIEEDRQRTRSALLLADQRARYGAAGVILEGSPLEVLAFSAGQEELDAMTIRQNTQVKVADLRAQAGGARLEGLLGQQDAANRARNLLADAVLKGDTAKRQAEIQGAAGMADASARGQIGINNARSSATSTLVSGFGSAIGSSSAQTLGGEAKRLWG